MALFDMYTIRSRIVFNTFFELFSWPLPQFCNILAGTVLVIEVADNRFQKNIINLKQCKKTPLNHGP